jgi:hypothetical protein
MLFATPQPAALSARCTGVRGARVAARSILRRGADRAAAPAAAPRAEALKSSRWRQAFETLSDRKVRACCDGSRACGAATVAVPAVLRR